MHLTDFSVQQFELTLLDYLSTTLSAPYILPSSPAYRPSKWTLLMLTLVTPGGEIDDLGNCPSSREYKTTVQSRITRVQMNEHRGLDSRGVGRT